MTIIATPVKREQPDSVSTENEKEAAMQHEEAAKMHYEAAKHNEQENQENAGQSQVIANGHSGLAYEAQKEAAKNNAAAAKKKSFHPMYSLSNIT